MRRRASAAQVRAPLSAPCAPIWLVAVRGLLHTVVLVSFTSSEQLALARAVTVQRRARLLAADNSASEPLSLTEAVGSGQAYFVVPRADLLVVDADLPEDPTQAADRAAAFDLLVETADRAGVPHVVVASGRPGNRHAYLLVGPGRSRLMAEQWCRSRGLDVRDRGVRPPGAPHRDGRHAAVAICPSDPQAVVAVLRGPVDEDAANRLARRLMPVELPARIRSALRHGHGAAGYDSPSHGRMALAVAIRARSGPRSLLEILLADRTSPLGQTYRARPARWQQQELGRLWDKAGRWLADRPASSRGSAETHRWAAAVASSRWAGMAGGTDLAVAEALLAIAQRVGTTAVGVALADLAISAGISVDTARASVRRLMAAQWLTVVAEATPRTSRVYRLVVPAGAQADLEDPGPRFSDVPQVGDLGSDLARWSALGKVTMRVARTLAGAGDLDVPALAERLRMRPAALRHHLRKLARFDLVRRCGALWSASVTPQATAALEQDLGVAGRRERQREELVEQRKRRAAMLHGYRLAWLAGHRTGRYARSAVSLPLAS
jgi:hypothetical protein